MKKMITIALFALASCGGAETTGTTTTTTSDGGGGTSATASSTATTGPIPFEISQPCGGAKGTRALIYAIQPEDGIADENGTLLDEDGAPFVRCDAPPVYPTLFEHFEVTFLRGSDCDGSLVEVMWFGAPFQPFNSIGASGTAIDSASLAWGPDPDGSPLEVAVVDVLLDPPIEIEKGWFCRGARLRALGPSSRSCVEVCKRPEAEEAEGDFYGATDADGTMQCNSTYECELEPLKNSPTIAVAEAAGADRYDLLAPASGTH